MRFGKKSNQKSDFYSGNALAKVSCINMGGAFAIMSYYGLCHEISTRR